MITENPSELDAPQKQNTFIFDLFNAMVEHPAVKKGRSLAEAAASSGSSPLPGILIACIFALWFSDLFKLKSMLDTTYLIFTSTNMYTTNDYWTKDWECYLNNEKEARQAIKLLKLFTSSYQNKGGQVRLPNNNAPKTTTAGSQNQGYYNNPMRR